MQDPDAYQPKRDTREQVIAALRELMGLGPQRSHAGSAACSRGQQDGTDGKKADDGEKADEPKSEDKKSDEEIRRQEVRREEGGRKRKLATRGPARTGRGAMKKKPAGGCGPRLGRNRNVGGAAGGPPRARKQPRRRRPLSLRRPPVAALQAPAGGQGPSAAAEAAKQRVVEQIARRLSQQPHQEPVRGSGEPRVGQR